MAIEWQVLGKSDADNALLVTIDSGQSREQLLFDCGQNCLSDLSIGAIQGIQHLFFSHFHMDHVSGFDEFFRHNYNRPSGPVRVWGPPGSIDLLAHRFLGFSWNLHGDQPGEWIVREHDDETIEGSKFVTAEAFATRYPLPEQKITRGHLILEAPLYRVESLLLPHGTIPSAAYRVVEADKWNIDPEALASSGIAPGPWLRDLAEPSKSDDETVFTDEVSYTLGELRNRLLKRSAGESIAYLTDFRILPGTSDWKRVVEWLEGTSILVCECQYSQRDSALAEKHGHMSADLVGELARDAKVKQLVLQHFSRRYEKSELEGIRAEVAGHFPPVCLPGNWS